MKLRQIMVVVCGVVCAAAGFVHGADAEETLLRDVRAELAKELFEPVSFNIGDYFFIQELKPYQSGQTVLHVSFEGESEVNDYMDTEGALMVKYAVEKKAKGEKKTIYSHTKTGDNMDLLKLLALMSAAVLVAILAILSWRRDRREDGDEA